MAVPYAHVVLAVISFFPKAFKTPMFSSYSFKIFLKANALITYCNYIACSTVGCRSCRGRYSRFVRPRSFAHTTAGSLVCPTRVQNVCACARSLFSQNSGCECELHDKNAFFELKSNFISIHWSFSLFALAENSNNGYGEVLPERAWTFKHDFRLWCKEESMWCKREELKQLINFVFVKF